MSTPTVDLIDQSVWQRGVPYGVFAELRRTDPVHGPTAMSGGLATLLEHPAQLALLRDDPSLIPTAVEEMLRYWPPIHHFRRTAMCEVEMRGKKIRKGDKIPLSYLSANRDESVFVDPVGARDEGAR